MLYSKYLNEKDQLQSKNNLFKFFIVVIGIAVLLNTAVTIWTLKYRTTVVVPAGINAQNSKFWVSGNSASTEYLTVMTRYIFSLYANFTPDTAPEQFAELLMHFDPSTYAQEKLSLYNQLQSIKTSGISEYFYISNIKYLGDNKIDVQGTLTQYSHDVSIEKDKQSEFILTYNISAGQFYVVSIVSK